MTILQKHFINLLFFPLFLFAATFKIDINLYSDKLYFDIFDHKWEIMPSNESMNRAINFSSISITQKTEKILFGYKYKSEGILRVNKGFIETWYYAQSDFNTLTKKEDIGYFISDPNIYGKLEYYQSDNIFLSKIYKNFLITLNFIRGKQLQYMKVDGSNTENRFLTDIKYFYTDKNLLTKTNDDDNYYTGYGLSGDIEFKLKTEKIDLNMGLYNLFGFINWQSITYLEYHFDSNTKYVGDDGYYHYKPFGSGKYIFNTNFHQELPVFFRYSYIYNFDDISIGNEAIYQNSAKFNTIFGIINYFKIGYLLENKDFIFGINTKKYKLEMSQNLKKHSKSLKLLVKIDF